MEGPAKVSEGSSGRSGTTSPIFFIQIPNGP